MIRAALLSAAVLCVAVFWDRFIAWAADQAELASGMTQ